MKAAEPERSPVNFLIRCCSFSPSVKQICTHSLKRKLVKWKLFCVWCVRECVLCTVTISFRTYACFYTDTLRYFFSKKSLSQIQFNFCCGAFAIFSLACVSCFWLWEKKWNFYSEFITISLKQKKESWINK